VQTNGPVIDAQPEIPTPCTPTFRI